MKGIKVLVRAPDNPTQGIQITIVSFSDFSNNKKGLSYIVYEDFHIFSTLEIVHIYVLDGKYIPLSWAGHEILIK